MILIIDTLKDDYEILLKKMLKADQMWLVSDTNFGFITYQLGVYQEPWRQTF